MTRKVVVTNMLLIILVCSFAAFDLSLARQRNLSVNPEVTARIEASDREFFKDYDVYSAGVREYPTALLFDLKDEYRLASRFWESPLSHEEIPYAIWRLEEQHLESEWNLPFEPQALNIINYKGQVVGYIYTSLNRILMDHKKDGRVTVFMPIVYKKDNEADDRRVP